MNAVAPSMSRSRFADGSFQALLQDEKGILELLVAARGSTLKNKDKTKLRDLLLEYSAETSVDEREKLSSEINTILSAHAKDFASFAGGIPQVEKTSSQNTESAPRSVVALGGRRPEPKFGPTARAVSVPRNEVRKLTINEDSGKVKEPKKEEALSATGANAPGGTLAPHVENPQSRIDEIKRIVNSSVGNPINLIESHPTEGKQYMNALLSAMKKSSGSGQAGELDVAMEALEQAFAAVEQIISGAPATLKKPKAEKETPKTTVPAEIKPKAEVQASIANVAAPHKTEVKPIAAAQKPLRSNTPSVPARADILRSLPPLSKKPSEGLYHLPEDESQPVAKGSVGGHAVKADVVATPVISKVSEPIKTKLQPVSTEATLPEKMGTLKQKMADKEAAGAKPISGLDSEVVSEGLARLLSEWKLFKSSGFLGTGPSGKEHPLYKQLSNLPMASVIAGRFEGSTPEIKQGITDYMNGWRYEQGILHEMGETFEHYLRRVIFQILERQRQQKLTADSRKM